MKTLRAILVDDELLALKNMETHLRAINTIEILASFQNPLHALESVETLRPDIVFLDIEMPVYNGLICAEKILDMAPETSIVFITAYNTFAIEAFELNAVDYIVKPIAKERLEKTIQRLNSLNTPGTNHTPVTDTRPGIIIRSFHSLKIESLDKHNPIEPIQWKTSKAQEIFSYLLYRHNQPVRKDSLIEYFFPHVNYSKGSTQLYTTIYQIRKILKPFAKEISLNNCIEGWQLHIDKALIDTEIFKSGIKNLGDICAENIADYRKILELYRGDYLEIYDYIWAEAEKERLRMMYAHLAAKIASYYSSRQEYREAVMLYKQLQLLNPYYENTYFELMKLYAILQDHSAVKEQYNQLVEMLDSEYNKPPEDDVRQWYAQWLR